MTLRGKKRQQSAMEYLMTYGWSILIIAIVLAALYSLGIFNNGLSGPRVPPNSCRVYRPNGPGTTTNINLEGVCNGELPQYVAVLNRANNAYVSETGSQLNIQSSITFSAWVNIPAIVVSDMDLVQESTSSRTDCNGFLMYTTPDSPGEGVIVAKQCGGGAPTTSAALLSLNTWYNVVGTYDGSNMRLYVNGALAQTSSSGSTTFNGGIIFIGTGEDGYTTASFSNIQVYNTALDANAVQALYLEGIGGAPIEPQNLAGWWPLNGDVNDYSGDASTPSSSAITFSSSWTNGYTIP